MIKNTVVGVLFVLLEIASCFITFWSISEGLEGTVYPFTDNLLMAVIVNTTFFTIIGILTLILLAAMNQRITKESFNYRLAVPFLIMGAVVAYFVVDWLRFKNLFTYEPERFDQLMLVISYAIPIMFFNIGIRIPRKKFTKD